MTLGEQIKQQREEQNMTQEELAERLGVSRQAVSKWESGAAQPQGANRAALCTLFSLDIPSVESRPPHRWLTIGGWVTAAVLFLALAALWLFKPGVPVEPQPTAPAILSIRFYDANQEEVLPEALWYNTAAIESILVSWTGGTPDPVQLFFTPSGSETMDQTELLLTRSIPDGENCVLLPARDLHQDMQGHLSISLSFGGQTVVSDLYNVFYDPNLLP